MTFGTYMSKQEKEKQDIRKRNRFEAISKMIDEEDEKIRKRLYKEREEIGEHYEKSKKEIERKWKKTLISLLISSVTFATLGAMVWNKIDKDAPYQTKSNGIEATLNQEYQNEKSKLASAYNFMKNKADSLYNAKKDSLQKVYENKLEKELK